MKQVICCTLFTLFLIIGCKKEASPVTSEPTITDSASTVRFIQDEITGLYIGTITNSSKTLYISELSVSYDGKVRGS